MATITLNTISTYWANFSNWVMGTSTSKPLIIKSGRVQSILTTTVLGVNGIYTSATYDSTTDPQDNFVTANAYSDQDGTLYLDVSMDSTNWNLSQCIVPVGANTAATLGWQKPLDRYYRIRFVTVNAQTVFRLSTTSYN